MDMVPLEVKFNKRGWPMCGFPNCKRNTIQENYSGHRFCQAHFDVIVTDNFKTCNACECYEVFGLRSIQDRVFCKKHFPKIRSFGECNYSGCDHHGTVKGFNSQWCPHHYLEMCNIRDQIQHDQSAEDLRFRLKEIQVRKDSNTKTGNQHRWYYLQLFKEHLTDCHGGRESGHA